jgi:hypothetical protein
MKKIQILGAVGVAVFLGSCASTTQITHTDTNEIKFYESGVVTRPLLADVEVGQSRESVTYDVPYYMSAKKEGRENALLKFKKEHNCDYVIDPVYEVTYKTGRKGEVTIALNGYPARYSNIKQVDTLPKSVTQYNKLLKIHEDKEVLNFIEEKEPTMGIELTALSYIGAQFDKKLANSGNRFYAAAEGYGLVGGDYGQLSTEFFDDDVSMATFNGNLNSYITLSGGLMREIPLARFLKVRAQGGVNLASGTLDFNSWLLNTSGGYLENSGGTFSKRFVNLGLRAGAGLDFKLYKSFSFVMKAHYNLNVLNIMSKPEFKFEDNTGAPVNDFKIRGTKLEAPSMINLSAGFRIVF